MDRSSVEISNETPYSVVEPAVASLVAAVLAEEESPGVVAVAFLDEAGMAELNTRFRGVAGPTDVLSFPGSGGEEDEWPEPERLEGEEYLGDIVVCLPVAEQNAADDGISLDVELRRLLVHGVLHLLGWDHEADRGEMHAREEAILGGLATLPEPLLGGVEPGAADAGLDG